MIHVKTSIWLKIILLGLFSAIVLFYSPFAAQIEINQKWFSQFNQQNDNILEPVLRSFCFAAFSSLIIVILSLSCSFYLRHISLKNPISSWLGFLILPVMLGNLSTAFVWKIVLLDNSVNNYLVKFLLLTIIQFWQYGSLFIYLLWINQQNSIANDKSYLSAVKLTYFEQIRDTYLPRQKNLLILVYLMSFIFCYYEDAKINFIFKASRGTHTELVSQWLNRNYQSNSLINPDFAFMEITRSGTTIMCLCLIGLLILLFGLLFGYRSVLKLNSKNYKAKQHDLKGRILLFSLVILILLPVLWVYFQEFGKYTGNLVALLKPILLTMLATLISTSVAILFAIVVRMRWPETLGTFNRRSLSLLIGLISLQLIPELLALICGFRWMQLIGYDSANNVTIAWVFTHVILSFPVLASFATVMHFSVNNQQLYYLNAHRLSIFERIQDVFLRPLSVQYLLILILAFSTIWNESVINNILSDTIPSFATELNKAINGKVADYGQGILYLSISLALALLGLMLWDRIIRRARKKSNTIS